MKLYTVLIFLYFPHVKSSFVTKVQLLGSFLQMRNHKEIGECLVFLVLASAVMLTTQTN